MPIDSSLTHDWTLRARNGVLEGDYIFNMEIFDMTDNSMAPTTTAGPAQSLARQQAIDVSFTPWNGWIDGHTYNISTLLNLPTEVHQAIFDISMPHLLNLLMLLFLGQQSLRKSSRTSTFLE